MEITPQNEQENNPSTNLKEDSLKNRIPTLTTKIQGSNNCISLISQYQWTQFPNKKTLTNRLATQTGPNILLLTGNPPQGKGQTLPQSERLENNFPSTWSEETS